MWPDRDRNILVTRAHEKYIEILDKNGISAA